MAKSRGGRRPGAGAKKRTYAEKRHEIRLYILGYKISKRGGKAKMKKYLMECA